MYFGGSHPCDHNGNPLDLVADTNVRTSEGIQTNFRFSLKPEGGYADHHHKMTTYVAMLSGPAQVLYPESTATTFPGHRGGRGGVRLRVPKHSHQPGWNLGDQQAP